MKIVIAGAGDVGFHIAELLAFENKDIVLIDNSKDVLSYASTHLDVLTLEGDSASIEVLKNADIENAQLVIAVTTSEKNNLITAILAKQLGAKQCIARVKNSEFLMPEQLKMFQSLGIDALISPSLLAAEEIKRLVAQCTFTDVFEFEEGKISLVGVTLNGNSTILNQKLAEVYQDTSRNNYRPIAILRGSQTIIPRGNTQLHRNDHVYFITPSQKICHLEEFVGASKKTIKDIMIIGGTGIAYETAKILEEDYNVILVESSKDRCKFLADHLPSTLVINADPSNTEALIEEGLKNMDAFIALTINAEINIIASLTAKNLGVYKTIAQVENKAYTHISQEIGVDTLINKKLIAANNIFRYIRKGKVEAITSLHGVDAEVIEYELQKDNQLTKKPIKHLHFPQTALVGGVIRNNESFIPDGDFQLQKGDKVIVLARPDAVGRLDKLFR